MNLKGSANLSGLLRKDQEYSFQKGHSRGNTRLISLPDQQSSSYRYSRKKREASQQDPQAEAFLIPSISLPSNNIQRVVMSESKKTRKVIQQLQTTKTKLEQMQFKFSNKIEGTKETVQILKRIQQQYSNQVATIKSNIQQKRIEDHSSMMKERQKITALFLEVVRLGDVVQKIQNGSSYLPGGVEQRLQYLQGKTVNNNRHIINLAHRSSTEDDVLSQFAQKIVTRVQDVQQTLLNFGRQRMKDKQQVSKIDTLTLRIAQDLNFLLNKMQSDFQNKIENRVGELVYKILNQKQQRMKSQDQIRRNLDFRDRLLIEKQRSQKQHIESKYLSMDTNVRNQFMRKDQSIKSLQQSLELQFKMLQKQIQEGNRIRQDIDNQTKMQLKRLQQGFRKQYDIYKQQQSDIINGVQDLIKVEIGTRLNSDFDLKSLSSSVATHLSGDITNFKDSFGTHIKQINNLVKQIQQNSAIKQKQIFNYVDQKIAQEGQKYNKLKLVFTKFTEQFRSHLMTTESNRKSIDQRFNGNEKDFNKLREQINNIIKLGEEIVKENDRIQRKDLTEKINKLEQQMNFSISTIKQNLEINKNTVVARIQSLKASQTNLNLKDLTDRFGNIKLLIQELKKQIQQRVDQLKGALHINEQRIQEQIEQLKIKTDDQGLKFNKQSQLKKSSNSAKSEDELVLTIKKLEKEVQANRDAANDNFKKIHQDVLIAYTNITQLQNIVKLGLQNAEEQVLKTRKDLNILQNQVKSSSQTVKQDFKKLLDMIEGNISPNSTL